MLNSIKRKRGLTFGLLVVVVAALLGVRAYNHEVAGDFARYYTAGKMIAEGEHARLYEDVKPHDRFEKSHNFRYLPIFAILMAPLSLLPIRVAFWIWKIFHVLAYSSGLYFSYRIARREPRSPAWMVVPFLFTVRLFMQNLQLGQINPIVIGLTIAGAYAWTRRKPVAAGVLIALGAAIKFTPIVFLLVFLARREWRTVATILVMGVLLVGVVPSIVLGPALNVTLLEEYFEKEGGLITDRDDSRVSGQSLKALAYRYLTPMNAVHQVKHNDPIYVNFADVDPEVVYLLYAAGCLALLATLAFVSARSRHHPDNRASMAVVASLATLAMLLVSPESRRAHFMILLLPFATLTYTAIVPFLHERKQAVVAILTLFAMAAIAIPSRGMVGKEVANVVDAYCNMGFAALVSFAALLIVAQKTSNVDTSLGSG